MASVYGKMGYVTSVEQGVFTAIKPKEKVIRTGLLFTAGLVAGEALTGVLIAVMLVVGINLAMFKVAPIYPGLLIWIFIAILLAYIPLRELSNE